MKDLDIVNIVADYKYYTKVYVSTSSLQIKEKRILYYNDFSSLVLLHFLTIHSYHANNALTTMCTNPNYILLAVTKGFVHVAQEVTA